MSHFLKRLGNDIIGLPDLKRFTFFWFWKAERGILGYLIRLPPLEL
jgi:hypothetical protein